jgi:hypothetical protein
MGERLDVEGVAYGERPDQSTPIPNKADDAWARLLELRDEARALGIEVDLAWSIAELERVIRERS